MRLARHPKPIFARLAAFRYQPRALGRRTIRERASSHRRGVLPGVAIGLAVLGTISLVKMLIAI
jgi:hypothetical protein